MSSVGEHVVLVLNALDALHGATEQPIFGDVLAALVKFLDDLDDATLDTWGLQRGGDDEQPAEPANPAESGMNENENLKQIVENPEE